MTDQSVWSWLTDNAFCVTEAGEHPLFGGNAMDCASENVDMARIITPSGLGPVKRDELEHLCGLENDPASAMSACLADMLARGLSFDDGGIAHE